MKRFILQNFGKGLDSTTNPTLLGEGFARISQNLLHNIGDNCAKLRNGITSVWDTRIANAPVYALHEYETPLGVVYRFELCNGNINTFSLNPVIAQTTLLGGLQSTNIPKMCNFNSFAIISDHRDNNYISNGVTAWPFQIIAPVATPVLTAVAGSNLEAGTYYYDYARYSSTTTELSPAFGTGTAITLSSSNRHVNISIGVITVEQFDQVKLYRTKVNTTGPYYYIGTYNTGTVITDNYSDNSLTVLSIIHTDAGATKTSRVEAATDCCVHRNRLVMVGLNGYRSRERWSQLNSFSFDSTTNAYHDLDPDDGDYLWRCFTEDGALVLFKDHSIYVRNGDIDENSFTWQLISCKESAIGAFAPFTATTTPIGIIFLAENGVYLYSRGQIQRISNPFITTVLKNLNYSRRLFFVGGYNPKENVYLMSVTPQGQSQNTKTYAYFLDTQHWSEWNYQKENNPSYWGLIHNNSGQIKAYFGGVDGYAFENDTSGYSDNGNNIEAILSLGRSDFNEAGYKKVYRMTIEFQKQTHSVNLQVGYTIDGDTEPTTYTTTLQSSGFRITIPVNRVCVGISPYIATVGINAPLEILRIEVDYDILIGRPTY